jgi:hypothetical protein
MHMNPRQQKIDIQPKLTKFYYFIFIFMFLAKKAMPCYLKHLLKPKTWYTAPFGVLEIFAPLANEPKPTKIDIPKCLLTPTHSLTHSPTHSAPA